MRLVIVESPFAGDRELNHAYLKAALADCFARGEAPIASHAIGPLVLDDSDPVQRKQGIDAGLAWYGAAHLIVFYSDLGWSKGMMEALEYADLNGIHTEYRKIPGWSDQLPFFPESPERLQ